jgi:hypothetical protein
VPCPVLWCVGTAGCHDPDPEDHDPCTRMHESKASNLKGFGYLSKVQKGDTGTTTGYLELKIVTPPAGFSSDGLRRLIDTLRAIENELGLAAAGIDLINADAIARICDADNSTSSDRALFLVPQGE